jgi:ribose 5-phosphate isomerase A
MELALSPKQRAARAALSHVQSGMVVGLGTGSTAEAFLVELAAAIKSSQLKDIRGVPTSRNSENLARKLAIPLSTLADSPLCDVTVDGADEIAPNLDLIKGLGGALLREKIVAQNSRKLIIIADESKVVPKLGTKAPLPVEVTQFGYETHEAFLKKLGADPKLRIAPGGMVFVTDNANYIYDCHFPGGIKNPRDIETKLEDRAGIVDCGFFLGLATTALIGTQTSVRELRR